MSINSEELVGYLRAEFDKASKWRLALLLFQFLAVVPAALSVVVGDERLLYFLAIAGPLLLILWWVARSAYARSSNAAHVARRASLIMNGLGLTFSPEEHQRLRQRFTVDPQAAATQANPNYYATAAQSGYQRLGEMIEESAFYSKEVHRVSAATMGAVFLVFILIAAAVAVVSVPYVARVTVIIGIKVVLSIGVFLLSSDVFGAMLDHHQASRETEAVQQRMAAAHAKGFPPGDVLLAMADYNSAMEGAPEAVPGVFSSIVGRLNRQWDDYKIDRNGTVSDQESFARNAHRPPQDVPR